jgi:hypothetical protein
MEVTCFEDEHGVTFGIAVILLAFYSLGYPLAALMVLCGGEGRKKSRVLFDDCRDSFFWWHSVQFLHNWCLAMLVAFNPVLDLKLFRMAIFDLSIITFIYVRRPFTEREDTRTAVTFGLVAAMQSIVLLVAAAMLTLPIPAINLPEWLDVPPPMMQTTSPTVTVSFAVIPFVWIMALTFSKPAHAIYRLCHRCDKAHNGGERDVKGLENDIKRLSEREKLNDKASGSLASLASSARNRRLGGVAAAMKVTLGSRHRYLGNPKVNPKAFSPSLVSRPAKTLKGAHHFLIRP